MYSIIQVIYPLILKPTLKTMNDLIIKNKLNMKLKCSTYLYTTNCNKIHHHNISCKVWDKYVSQTLMRYTNIQNVYL